MFGEGISKVGEILDLGVTLGIVQKSGAWFNYNETRLGQGRDNAKIYLKEHPDLMDEIEAQVRANADKLTAKGKKGKAAEPAAAPAPAAEEKPAARPAARASEADLDIMVED